MSSALGSTDGSIWQTVFVYNGSERIFGSAQPDTFGAPPSVALPPPVLVAAVHPAVPAAVAPAPSPPRTLTPAGDTSSAASPGRRRMTTIRPPSWGRLSDHQQVSPTTWSPASETRAPPITSGESGDGQVP